MDAQLGNEIRNARKRKGLTLAKLAERVGVGAPYLSKIERGEVKAPNIDLLRSLADLLELPDLLEAQFGRPEADKTVFVAAPSGEPFDSVYSKLIAQPLARSGFRVDRAQDLSSARNILADIVQGIEGADIVVADLTDLNPNVFYEVGVAHALRKPVILLTQDIDTLPFDLQQYRTIAYSIDFDKAERLADELKRLVARVAADNRLASGPFSDFSAAQGEQRGPEPEKTQEDGIPDRDDSGFLDFQVEIEDAFVGAVPIVEAIVTTMTSMNERVARLAEQIEKAKTPDGQVDVRRVRAILRAAAQDFSTVASELRDQRVQYETRITPVEDNLERYIENVLEVNDGDVEKVRRDLDSLKGSRQQIEDSRLSCVKLGEKISELPSMERHINRSLRTLRDEIFALADVLESTVRFFDRGFAVIDRRTQDGGGQLLLAARLR